MNKINQTNNNTMHRQLRSSIQPPRVAVATLTLPNQTVQVSNIYSTCKLRDGAPAAVAILGNVVHELLVLLGRPQPPPQLLLVAARRLLRHAGQSSVAVTVGRSASPCATPPTDDKIDRCMEAEI